jgi:hypothetical protein
VLVWVGGSGTDVRDTLVGMGVAATLCNLGTLGRRVRVREAGTHAEGSAECPGVLVARIMRGSKTGVVGECEGGARATALAYPPDNVRSGDNGAPMRPVVVLSGLAVTDARAPAGELSATRIRVDEKGMDIRLSMLRAAAVAGMGMLAERVCLDVMINVEGGGWLCFGSTKTEGDDGG